MTADELIDTLRALLLCPMDAALKLRSMEAALDLYDRPMEDPETASDNDARLENEYWERRISEAREW